MDSIISESRMLTGPLDAVLDASGTVDGDEEALVVDVDLLLLLSLPLFSKNVVMCLFRNSDLLSFRKLIAILAFAQSINQTQNLVLNFIVMLELNSLIIKQLFVTNLPIRFSL